MQQIHSPNARDLIHQLATSTFQYAVCIHVCLITKKSYKTRKTTAAPPRFTPSAPSSASRSLRHSYRRYCRAYKRVTSPIFSNIQGSLPTPGVPPKIVPPKNKLFPKNLNEEESMRHPTVVSKHPTSGGLRLPEINSENRNTQSKLASVSKRER